MSKNTNFTYSDNGKCRLFPLREYDPWKKPELPKLLVEVPDTQFKRNYPPDQELGKELAENARVWHVYRDQAIEHDDSRLSGWNNTINILLTFAGLFSAAVTAFVVESYQFLQPPGLDLGLALYSLAVNDTATLLSLATSHSQPSSPARWINGLWFTSLFFSLAAAFLCILVKQWLDEYTARTRASSQNPKHWTRRRTFYFRAIDAWGVPVIISLLPLLLHAALFLFFAGIVVLLWSLNRPLATWLSSLALPALCLYLISLLIPVWNTACPFATPLARLIRELYMFFIARALPRAVSIFEHAAIAVFHVKRISSRRRLLGAIFPHPRSIHLWSTLSILDDIIGKTAFDQIVYLDSLRRGEDPDAKGSAIALVDRLDCDALCWLIQSVSDTDASAVAFQALGAAEPCSDLAEQMFARGLTRTMQQHFLTGPSPGGPVEAARVLKSTILLHDFRPDFDQDSCLVNAMHHPFSLNDDVFPARVYPDMDILRESLFMTQSVTSVTDDYSYTYIRHPSHLSPSMHSTCMLMSTTPGFGQPHMLLFLSHCDLSLVTSAQWAYLMPTLWGTNGSCPRHHLDLSHCRASCLAELVSRLLLRNVLDEIVLTRLWEKACSHLPVLSNDLPSFWRYITSDAFIDRKYSRDTLERIQFFLNDPRGWEQVAEVNLDWFTAWRYVAYSFPARSWRMSAPASLISSALAYHGDGHGVLDTVPFPTPFPAEEVLRSTLQGSRSQSRSIPSLWHLLIDNDESFRTPRALGITFLARALCSLSRTGDHFDGLVDAFFAMRFASLMSKFDATISLYRDTVPNARARNLELVPHLRENFVEICRHLMEMRPSWWTEGMTLLATDAHTTQGTSTLSFAEELTAEALRQGPCSDCPLSDTSRTFDVSLRNFVPFPFSIYPLVDSDPNPA